MPYFRKAKKGGNAGDIASDDGVRISSGLPCFSIWYPFLPFLLLFHESDMIRVTMAIGRLAMRPEIVFPRWVI